MATHLAAESFVEIADVRATPNCGCITANYPADAVIQELIDTASDMTHIVTGGGISGRQAVVARPCRRLDGCDPCPCCGLDSIPLGTEDPEVTSVKIDGVELDGGEYWLHWNRVQWMLGRRPIGGPDRTYVPWPSWQDRWRYETETNTFAIHFTQGVDVDQHLIRSAVLETICDLAQDDTLKARSLEGAQAVNMGGAQVILDRNIQAASDDTRLNRIKNGETGPFMRRLMGIMAPAGRSASMVWAPELLSGWDTWLQLDV